MSELQAPPRSRVTFVIIAVIVVTCGTAAALWAWFAGPNTSKYEPVIQRIAAGEFTPDERGRIDLSKSARGLTPQDECFITRRGDGSFAAFFPTLYGKGTSIMGLLYTSRPLQLSETYVQTLGTTLDRRVIDVGSWSKLVLDTRLNDHWYRVSRGMR